MKKIKKLFKNNKNDRNDLVITKDHNINADELADYIRNLEKENRDLKNITTEHNTISYKLGKAIIDTLNSKSSRKKLPSKLLDIYIESRKRKLPNLQNAGLIDKALILLSDDKLIQDYSLNNNKKYINNKIPDVQQNSTTILNSVLNPVRKNKLVLDSNLKSELISAFSESKKTEALINTTIKDNSVTEITHIEVQEEGDIFELSAAVLYRLKSNQNSRKAIVLLEFLDIAGNKLQYLNIDGIGVSAAFGQHFRYLNNNCDDIEESPKDLIKFPLPISVKSVKISIVGMGLINDEQVDIRLKARCYSEKVQQKKKTEALINTTINDNSITEITHIDVQEAGDTLEISAAVLYRLKSSHNSRKAIILLEFLDFLGNKLKDINIEGVGISAAFGQHFRYINNNCNNLEENLKNVIKFSLPISVKSVKVSVVGMGLKDNEQVDIRLRARCYNAQLEKEISCQKLESQSLPHSVILDPNNRRYTSDLNIACILDEFTTECLEYEVNLIKVTQENWQSQLTGYNIDFLLVESCWRGNDGNWGTLTKGSSGGKKLSPLLNYCKKNNIPTVFWNKEDPPHYDKFGAVAKLFDIAITTDINMVDRYKEDFGIDVYPLSFGAQPKIHNPSPVIKKLERAVFAGSYYGDKPQRCADFNDIMSQLEIAKINYDIFDRNYNRNIDKFAFPDHYQSHIIGTLPPEDIWKVHKGYKYQVNMNTVQDSSTMFARRVYESLASGTPIISNDSVGMRKLFGDLVIMPNDHLSVAEQLVQLESSPAIYNEIARLGVRRVMREHTYGHRIQEICKLLGMDIEVSVPKAILAITVSSEAEIIKAKNMFDIQTAPSKHLFIELENFDNAYKYLNKSDDNVSYAMKLGHGFYDNESQYYKGDKVLKCSVNDVLSAESLEDFTYWGAI